jgi:hypothetical protein
MFRRGRLTAGVLSMLANCHLLAVLVAGRTSAVPEAPRMFHVGLPEDKGKNQQGEF